MSLANQLAARPIVIAKRGVSHVGAGLYLDNGLAMALGGVTACGDLDPEFEFPTAERELIDVTCTTCREAVGRVREIQRGRRRTPQAPLPPASLATATATPPENTT